MTALRSREADHPEGREAQHEPLRPRRVALLGNPNTGKTTLFNRLTGLRHKTSNFPGTTLEARIGRVRTPQSEPDASLELIDLPGIYSLELDQLESEVCRAVLAGRASPRGQPVAEPDAVCVVADATNLPRNLMFVGEALRRRLPTVVLINMIDLARRRGLHLDAAKLSADLGCPVVLVSARTGECVDGLDTILLAARIPTHTPPGDEAGLRNWADAIYERAAGGDAATGAETFTDRLDRVFTHPVAGMLVFAAVMAGLFWLLFAIAAYPMDLIDAIFGSLGSWVEGAMPKGMLSDLLVGGIISGVGATVIFLPQICLLFFVISLLEDTGYLARAAFVMDRALRPFGLPGHAFMPLLSSHACALPGIMATRAIPDHRERLATILVAPFMSCSARLPVYALLTMILFPNNYALAALAFVGCYALGVFAGILSALLARRTILRGQSRPMALELPTYKWPSLRTALLTTADRGLVFLKKAGTNILCICIVLWWLSSYPKVEPPPEVARMHQTVASFAPPNTAFSPDGGPFYIGEDATRAAARYRREAADLEATLGHDPARVQTLLGLAEFNDIMALPESERQPAIDELSAEAQRLEKRHAARHSFAGRLGRLIQPALAPLGYDWQLSVGVLTSFAAREVFASTMAVVVTGDEEAEDSGVQDAIAHAPRDDGTPIFTPAVCWSLLVYYVLAMQCLPTLAVTARESGHWKWALLQLAWMCGLAYVAAMVVYQVLA